MVRSFEYEFGSPRDILDIQSVWQSLGGYDWRAFDNDHYGIYIVARKPETNLRIKVSGEKRDYTLETDFNVDPGLLDETMKKLFQDIFETLLPAVEAVNVRDVDAPFLSSTRAPSRSQLGE